MSYRTIGAKADTLARYAAIALGAAIPISTALDNLLLLAVLAAWLAGAGYRSKFLAVRGNGVALAALALAALIALGTWYGPASAAEARAMAGKYADLWFVALFVFLFSAQQSRCYALYAFIAALLATLVLSLLLGWGLIPHSAWVQGNPDNAYAFKNHITQNLLMAFGAYLFALKARYAEAGWQRWTWGGLAALAAIDVLFLVQGRTGYLVLLALLVYFGWSLLHGRMRWLALGALPLLAAAAYYGSATLQQRVDTAAREYAEWQPNQHSPTSIGERLEFYRSSLLALRERPLFGAGTGGFAHAYAGVAQGRGLPATQNPHNEYLNLAVQLGVLGLGLFLFLLYSQWRLAPRLAAPLDCYLARGLVLTMAVGCAVNSLLMDHAEGLFYAWMSGLLYAGLRPAAETGAAA